MMGGHDVSRVLEAHAAIQVGLGRPEQIR